MATVNVYLNFIGNCKEAFLLYRSVFGGEFSYMGRFKDMLLKVIFWGDYYSMFTDKFGINWMVSFDTKKGIKE